MNDMVKIASNSNAPARDIFTPDDIKMIKAQIMPTASDHELAYFLQFCKSCGLNPLMKEIYAVPRFDKRINAWKFTPQVGVGGLRIIAERSQKWAGVTETIFYDNSGKEYNVWLQDGPPKAARVGIKRKGWDDPVYGIARFDSYCAKNRQGELSGFWKTHPSHMIEKVAESLALRRAFPQELTGVYSEEEMDQANNNQPAYVEVAPEKPKVVKVVANKEQRISNMLEVFAGYEIKRHDLEEHLGIPVEEFTDSSFNECRKLLRSLKSGAEPEINISNRPDCASTDTAAPTQRQSNADSADNVSTITHVDTEGKHASNVQAPVEQGAGK